MLSLIVGIIRAVLDFTYPAPPCGSGGEDTRPSIVSHVDFLHFAAILSILSAVFMIIISLMTTPRPERKVRITFPRSGRRHSILFGIKIFYIDLIAVKLIPCNGQNART